MKSDIEANHLKFKRSACSDAVNEIQSEAAHIGVDCCYDRNPLRAHVDSNPKATDIAAGGHWLR